MIPHKSSYKKKIKDFTKLKCLKTFVPFVVKNNEYKS